MKQEHTKGRPDVQEELRGLHLHFAPTTGIAGDMTVAALVDAGVPEKVVVSAVGAMQVPGLTVAFHGDCAPLPGLRYMVTWPGNPGHPSHHPHDCHPDPRSAHYHPRHHHRRYADIQELLRSSPMPRETKHLAEKLFARLAAVEATIHDQPLGSVAFHEVGAFDSIADIVGVAAAVAWLEPASMSSSPPLLGSGTIECAHGLVRVPAPATASLLDGRDVLTGGEGELTTPTGALVLSSLVSDFGPPPKMRIVSRGLGIGTKLLAGRPNGLQVVLGQKLSATTNRSIDDASS
jgi:pyridinium-3,5-bisthiocarboxylic acid mononucleotide nickel chelatase